MTSKHELHSLWNFKAIQQLYCRNITETKWFISTDGATYKCPSDSLTKCPYHLSMKLLFSSFFLSFLLPVILSPFFLFSFFFSTLLFFSVVFSLFFFFFFYFYLFSPLSLLTYPLSSSVSHSSFSVSIIIIRYWNWCAKEITVIVIVCNHHHHYR